MFKKLSFLSVLAFGLFLSLPALAQDSSIEIKPPSIFISSVNLDKNTYQGGDTVNGSIVFVNQGDTDQADVYADVSLASGYSTSTSSFHIPSAFYESKATGPIVIKSNSQVKVPFSYVLPKAISGNNLGIHVSARLISGLPLGWNDAFLTITKSQPALTVKDYFIDISNQKYQAQAGPTLYASTTASFHLIVNNSSSESISVLPQDKIYDRVSSGKLVNTINGSVADIAPGDNYEFIIQADHVNGSAGVYASEISLVDSSGTQRAPVTEFRYIVAGAIATIQSATLDKRDIGVSGTVNTTVYYSGSPIDIKTGRSSNVSGSVLDVKIYNASSNALIGEATTSPDLVTDLGTSVVPVKVSASASSIMAVIQIVKDGVVLSTYKTTPIPPDTSFFTSVYFIVLVIVILIAIMYFLIKRKKSAAAIPLSILIALALIGSSMLIGYQADALTTVTNTTS